MKLAQENHRCLKQKDEVEMVQTEQEDDFDSDRQCNGFSIYCYHTIVINFYAFQY